MLYRLLNPKKQAPWQLEYENLYAEFLKIPYQDVMDKKDLVNLTEKDYLWIQHYCDIDTPEVRSCKAIRMAQVNGTAVNQYIGAVNPEQEKKEYSEILDIGIVFDNETAKAMKKEFNSTDFWSVGFPISDEANKYEQSEKKKQICVAGRLDAFKNVNINIWLTEDLRKLGYKVIFCYPDKDEQEEKSKFYTKRPIENVEFKRCSKTEWLRIAGESEFYLISSLDDNCSVSMWEAYKAGCYLLVADIANGIVRYPAYISTTFKAFDKMSLNNLVNIKPKQVVDLNRINPELCAKRLEKYINENSL